MNRKAIRFAVCMLVTVLALANAGLAIDVIYKDVPDVDKNPGTPSPDNSCWQAAAANLLAGGGYGTGADAQARADSIYSTLTLDLGTANLGDTARGINYWLHMYGKNPDSPEYLPAATYTDVTAVSRMLDANDYDFLLDELDRCQYVAVSFDQPPHVMTLVGGMKHSPFGGSVSIWHDSDKDVGNPSGTPDDDAYDNDFITNGVWNLRQQFGGPLYMQNANGYTTLCPGLNKPEDAVRNYDVAWFKQGPTLSIPDFRVAGEKADGDQDDFDAPYWLQGETVVHIDNEFVPEMHKEIWLLVDYIDRDLNRDAPITLIASDGTSYDPTSIEANGDGGQLLFYWNLPDQPEWEEIIFPSTDYFNLTGDVKDWNLATICTPEPATLTLLCLGGLAILKRRRRR